MSVKLVLSNKSDKHALQDWNEYLESIRSSTTIDLNESAGDKAKRMRKLEADPEEWFKYYFPKYCSSEPADFHKKSTQRFLKTKRIYQRRAWARGLSKSTRRMFEVLYIQLALKTRINLLLVSKSEDNAIRLLSPYRANLVANQRLTNDYGIQEGSKWAEEEFITRGKSSFRAVGAGQNPRGARLEEMRVNFLLFDDVDDDEVCMNEERLESRWLWIEQAVIPTVDISNDYRICFDNNIIAEDSIAVRAGEKATDSEIINIRDGHGKSVWPQKNSEADIDFMLSIVSYESGQKEYFNNPMTQGKTFKEITWGKCPNIKSLPFIVVYADPATSNKDKPTVRSKAHNSCKAVAILGYSNLKFYLYKCFVDNTTNYNFIEWLYASRDYIAGKATPYFFIENNTLQDPFYQQVLLPLIYTLATDRNLIPLPISPDDRPKGEKWTRIEGTLEPLFRLGTLVFNVDEIHNPHMKRMAAQFKAAKATSKELGGPDAVQGATVIIQEKNAVATTGGVEVIERPVNPKRF